MRSCSSICSFCKCPEACHRWDSYYRPDQTKYQCIDVLVYKSNWRHCHFSSAHITIWTKPSLHRAWDSDGDKKNIKILSNQWSCLFPCLRFPSLRMFPLWLLKGGWLRFFQDLKSKKTDDPVQLQLPRSPLWPPWLLLYSTPVIIIIIVVVISIIVVKMRNF